MADCSTASIAFCSACRPYGWYFRSRISGDRERSVMKGLCILGSTGSIGTNTLRVVRGLPDRFRVVALSAGKNLDLLAQQVKEFSPEVAVVGNAECIEPR